MRKVRFRRLGDDPQQKLKSAHQTNFDRFMKKLEDPEVQKAVRQAFDVTLTDIDHIRVRPACQPDELAITIASKDGRKVHLLVKGHYA